MGAELLADMIADAREAAGLSLRELADKCGGAPTSSTIHAIEAGRSTGSRENLEVLAAALGLPRRKVLEAAGRSRHDLGEFILPVEADELNAAERRAVLAVVHALLAARQGR